MRLGNSESRRAVLNHNSTWPVEDIGNRAGQLRVIIAGIVTLAAIAYLVLASFPQGAVYYQTVQEIKQSGNDAGPVRVAGTVADGSIKRDIVASRLQFLVAEGRDTLSVVYTGIVPDIFGPGIEVVVEGQRDSMGVFQAQTLLAKCPSRFQSAVPTPEGANR